MDCMVASSIPCKLSLCADRAHACAGDSYVSSAIDVACPTSQSVFAIASPHELHGDSWPSSSTGTRSFCCNQQFSITAITTSSGTVTERYAYTAYGLPTVLDASGTSLSSSSISNRYTYTGREWDATLGLYHFRARWMSPIAGRFLSRDPIGYEDGDHLYRNAMGLIRVDPSGNWVCNCNCTEWQYSSGSTVPLYSSHSYEYKFIVAAGNPSQQQALVECNAACDIDRSSTSSCSGSGKRCSGSIQTNWTPDESKAFGICSKINKSLGKCSNCTQADCEKVILDLTQAISQTWLLNILGFPLGPQTCSRWANSCFYRLPEVEKNPCVAFAGVNMQNVNAFGGLTSAHFFVKIIFCDGSTLYADNGALGGGDHIFFVEDLKKLE
jgi:RHS repeat-associated core domain